MTPLELRIVGPGSAPGSSRVVTVLGSELGEARDFLRPWSEKEETELRWYLEVSSSVTETAARARIAEAEAVLEQIKQRLRAAFDPRLFLQWLAQNHDRDASALRVSGDAAQLAAIALPWELVGTSEDEGLADATLRVTRTIGAPTYATDPELRPLRLLYLLSRPAGLPFLDPRSSASGVLEAGVQTGFAIDFCRPPTLVELIRRLDDAETEGRPYSVLHFDGHGLAEHLLFERSDGSPDLIRNDDLAAIVSSKSVSLVVLEACRTAGSLPVESAAGSLATKGVPAVVAMRFATHVDLTSLVVRELYAQLARGESVGSALAHARRRAAGDRSRRTRSGVLSPTIDLFDWFVPQLYSSCSSELRFSPSTQPAPPKIFSDPSRVFVGRARSLLELERRLRAHGMVYLHGFAGAGKTALAEEAAAWWLHSGWFDAAALIDLRGADSIAESAIRALIALGEVGGDPMSDAVVRLAALCARRRTLLVFDGADSIAQLAELIDPCINAGAKVLLIGRASSLSGLQAHAYELGALDPESAVELAASILVRCGVDAIERERRGLSGAALRHFVDTLRGHALAIVLLTPLLKDEPARVVEFRFGELLGGGHESEAAQVSVSLSLDRLSQRTRAALSAIAQLSGGIVRTVAWHVSGMNKEEWQATYKELESIGLARETAGIVSVHPLLADLVAPDPAEPIKRRVIEAAHAICAWFSDKVRSPSPHAAIRGMSGSEPFLRRALGFAAELREVESIAAIAAAYGHHLRRLGRSGEAGALLAKFAPQSSILVEDRVADAAVLRERAVALAQVDAGAARRALETLLDGLQRSSEDSRHARALVLLELGRVLNTYGRRPEEALAPLSSALEIFLVLEQEKLSDAHNRGALLGTRANILSNLDRFDEALADARGALEISSAAKDAGGMVRDEIRVGQILESANALEAAADIYRSALPKVLALGDAESEAIIYQSMGTLERKRGRVEEAEAAFRLALTAFDAAGDGHGRAQVLLELGNAAGERSALREALEWYQQAEQLADALRSAELVDFARANRAVILTKLADAVGDVELARPLLEEALRLETALLDAERATGQKGSLATSLLNLADTHRRLGQLELAQQRAEEALQLQIEIGDVKIYRAWAELAAICEARGEVATTLWEKSRAAWNRYQDWRDRDRSASQLGGG